MSSILKDQGKRRARQRESPTLTLLAWLPVSALKHALSYVPPSRVNSWITVCGMIMLFAPLGLWFAWSQFSFCLIFGTSMLAFAILMILVWLGPGDYF